MIVAEVNHILVFRREDDIQLVKIDETKKATKRVRSLIYLHGISNS